MPKIAVYKFLTFYIFAFDAISEPPHLHVARVKGSRGFSAKIWLDPVEVAVKGSLNAKELGVALGLIGTHRDALIRSFNDVKRGKKIRTLILKKK